MNIKSTNMKTQELSALLIKYYGGETSEEEETLLKKVFSEADLPPELEDEKEIFNFYVSEQRIPMPSHGFENRIIAAIDDIERIREIKNRRRIIYASLSSAAALILFIASYFFFVQKAEQVDTFSDPAVAYAETMKILKDVSVTFNKGRNALEPVGKLAEVKEMSLIHINKSSMIIEKTIKKIDYLDKVSVYDSIGEISNK